MPWHNSPPLFVFSSEGKHLHISKRDQLRAEQDLSLKVTGSPTEPRPKSGGRTHSGARSSSKSEVLRDLCPADYACKVLCSQPASAPARSSSGGSVRTRCFASHRGEQPRTDVCQGQQQGAAATARSSLQKTAAQLSFPWFLLMASSVVFGKPFPHAGVWHPNEADVLSLLCQLHW